MQGIITSYVETKGYGFIQGSDNKDYFFHKSEVNNKESIIDGASVGFSPKASRKGYSAVSITISKISETKYITPDEVYTSKGGSIKGWEILDYPSWTILSKSETSADDARRDILTRAELLGANAILDLHYSKETGSKASDSGQGTYHFSIHTFSGIPVNIGKKHAKGSYTEDELCVINKKASSINTRLEAETNQRTFLVFLYYITALIIFGLGYRNMPASGEFTEGMLGGGFMIIVGFFIVKTKDYAWWLNKR